MRYLEIMLATAMANDLDSPFVSNLFSLEVVYQIMRNGYTLRVLRTDQ